LVSNSSAKLVDIVGAGGSIRVGSKHGGETGKRGRGTGGCGVWGSERGGGLGFGGGKRCLHGGFGEGVTERSKLGAAGEAKRKKKKNKGRKYTFP